MIKKSLIILSCVCLLLGFLLIMFMCAGSSDRKFIKDLYKKQKITKTASGRELVCGLAPTNWESKRIIILETPTPYIPEAPNSSAIHVTETTEGKLTFAYTDFSGQSVKIERLIHIDNCTKSISYNGAPVTTLGDIFLPLPSPMGSKPITLELDFSYWITISLK